MTPIPTEAACECSEPVTGSYFVSAYPPFEAWTSNALDSYHETLSRPGKPEVPLGLYVHIPFCERRCDFCYYLSYQGRSIEEIDRYLEALPQELGQYCRTPALAGRKFDFVYFGGGTPSLLSAKRLETLLQRLTAQTPSWSPREFTFECAPKSVSRDKLRLLADYGVTRISLGVQQLDDGILMLNGRVHLIADIERAFEDIHSVGFDVVNLDLIVGLVGETDTSFFTSLEGVVAMAPQSVTLYQLEIPHNTPLFRVLGQRGIEASLPTWEVKRRRLSQAFDLLEANGFSIRSAYTAVRDLEQHAFLYQDYQYRGADLLGIGASSFSYLDGIHQQNIADLAGYLEAVTSSSLPLGRAHALSPKEQMVRELVLQLKLGSFDGNYLRSKFGVDPQREFAAELETLTRKGWLAGDGPVRSLTRSGLLRADALLERFYLPEHRAAAAC